MHYRNPPDALAEDLRRLTASELSMPSRLRYVALLLTASAMSIVVLALLLTEPVLPLRTSIALGVMGVIGLSWMVFAAWVLTRKRVLLAGHRIVAGRLAVTFCTVFVIGAIAVGVETSRASSFAAAAMGVVMLVVAVTMLARAKQRFKQLSQRRDELQQEVNRRNR